MTQSKRRMSPLALVLALSAVFFTVFLVVSGVLYYYRSPSAVPSRPAAAIFGGGAVGVIEVNGVIMDSKKVLSRLERFEENSSVKAVVLRLNSPGGAVGPSQEIYEAVKNYKKPVVASMGSMAASGAFYIAVGAKKVFANPGTLTGSIGVIMQFANLERLYDWAKLKRFVIKSGKFKDAGSEFREMSAEERELFQNMVDDVMSQFKQAIITGRKLPAEHVDRYADGRIMSGSQAKAAKLVDELGTMRDAINEAAKMADIKGKPTVIYPERGGPRWLQFFMDGHDEDAESADSLGHGSLFGALAELGPLGRAIAILVGEASSKNGFGEAISVTPGLYWLWTGAH